MTFSDCFVPDSVGVYCLYTLGVLGSVANFFTIYIHFSSNTKKIRPYSYCLINVMISSTATLLVYTLILAPVEVNLVKIECGLISYFFETSKKVSLTIQAVFFFLSLTAYLLSSLVLHQTVALPFSKWKIPEKNAAHVICVFYASFLLLMGQTLYGLWTYDKIEVATAEMMIGELWTLPVLLMYFSLLVFSFGIFFHTYYSLFYDQTSSPATLKMKKGLVRTNLVMGSIIFVSSCVLTFFLELFSEAISNYPKVIEGMRVLTHIHLPLINLCYLIYIKPYKERTKSLLCGCCTSKVLPLLALNNRSSVHHFTSHS